MKVAICISGHVRNFEDCKSSFVSSIVENIIQIFLFILGPNTDMVEMDHQPIL